MSTTRLKQKLSKLISSQLPEFIREDYTTFKLFLEAYYEYLEQDQHPQELLQNALLYNDIDRTTTSFIDYFYNTYCTGIPKTVSADRKLLLKHVQQLYSKTGSTKGFQLLFKLIFNKEATLFFPSSQVLKPSDGVWNQDAVIFVKVIYGDPDAIVNKTVSVSSNEYSYPIYIKEKRLVDIKSGSIITSSTDTFSLVIDNSKNIPIAVGDSIYYNNFLGIVQATPVVGRVIKGGSGFKIGDVFEVVDPSGYGLKFRIAKVGAEGVLKNIEIVEYGIGYLTNFYSYISTQKSSVLPPYQYSGGNLVINDTTNGFVDFGYINSHNYTNGTYVDITYVGTVLSTFRNDSSILTGSLNFDAVLFFTLGSKALYPGYYSTNDSFLSDDIFIQDEDYFIPFSYVINVEETISSYYKIVRELMHPAGTRLYGNYTITTVVDVERSISTDVKTTSLALFDNTVGFSDLLTRYFTKILADTVTIGENKLLTLTKPVSDTISSPLDQVSLLPTKGLSHSLSLNDSLVKTLSKVIDDNTLSITELLTLTFTKLLNDSFTTDDAKTLTLTKPLIDSIDSPLDIITLNTTKNLSNISSVHDEIPEKTLDKTLIEPIHVSEFLNFNLSKVLEDSFNALESIFKTINKSLSDSYNLSDTAELTPTKNLQDSVSTSVDEPVFSITLNKLDNVYLQENIEYKNLDKVLTDTFIMLEQIGFNSDKYTTDNQNITDNGYIILNPYSAEDYFLEQYVGTPINF